MLTLRRPLARSLFALGVSAAVLGPASARAGEGPSQGASVQSSWRLVTPTLSLQPEGARLFLSLPPEWLPQPELARLGPFGLDKRLVLVPGRPDSDRVFICQLGLPRLQLDIEDRARSLGFGVTVLPRAAVAVLRFDPLPPHLR